MPKTHKAYLSTRPLHTKELIETLRIQASIAREERAKTEALFTSISEGVIATDETGKIIRVNQQALELLGFSRRELIGKWFPKRIRAVNEKGEPIRNIDRPLSRAFMNGETVNERLYYLRKDGSIMPTQVSVAPMMLRAKPIGAIELFHDVTLEDEMDRLKADFISLASHQLRTPLAAVQTYTNMLREGYAGPISNEQRHFLNTILSASDRMNDLISTLLNITRVEADNLLVHAHEFPLMKVIEEVVDELQPSWSSRQQHIKIKPLTSPILVNNDDSLVHEVITNLVNNSIKYTPEDGKIDIAVHTTKRNATIIVKDNGFGIPPSEQDRIFTKFYRASNILSRDTTGTGLGLYLVKNIAQKLGGDVWFESRENKGTKFYFSLPLHETQKEQKIRL